MRAINTKGIMLLSSSLVISVSVFLLVFQTGCSRKEEQKSRVRLEKITVTVTAWPGSASVFIAHEKGFFRDEGLDAALLTNKSGHLGLADVLSGKADFATLGETPIARAAVAGKPVSVVATISEIDRAILIIARKDRGILKPYDLRGKKIGVTIGTTGDFFLHIYLTTSHVNPKDVRIIDIAPDKMVEALLSGEVDAVSTWSPYTLTLQNKLGDDGLVLDEPGLYSMTWNIAVKKELTVNNPDVIVRFLRAIIRANRFITEHPAEARAIIAKNIGMETSAIEKEWDNYHPRAVLDQSLILTLEDQVRWMIKRDSGKAGFVPNFIDFIYTGGLRAVQPEAVSISGK